MRPVVQGRYVNDFSDASGPSSGRANLVAHWERVFRLSAPRHLSRQLLERSLAYQLQAREHGSVSRRVKETLRATAESRGERTCRPTPGSQLIREWHGILHVVDVLDKGFEYRGRQYRSLTAIACEITGSHWPGPRFFGLRRRRK